MAVAFSFLFSIFAAVNNDIPFTDMKTKPYPPYEEQPMVAGEPTAAYQRTDPATYRQGVSPREPLLEDDDDEAFETFMNADLSELGDGFRPFTWEEARQWIAEAEAEENAIPHEEVMREMREMILAYGN